MRITNNMMTTNLLLNINRNLQKMSKKQDELATGKRIHVPSDDPVLASKILARRTDLAELEQYDKNTRDALGWMEVTEKALEDNGDLMQRIRELTVQAANGTNTAEDTQKIKLEVENMKEQLIANANTTFAGRYIFSGFETDKKLLNEDGTFNIDIDKYSLDNKPVVKYEIGVGQSIDVMTSGLDIYGTVKEDNVMTDDFPSGISSTGVAATKAIISGSFQLDADYSVENLDITVDGITYGVNAAGLDGSGTPITKTQVLDAYKNAAELLPGTGKLSDVANIYFDSNDQLVIESKSYVPVSVMSNTPIPVKFPSVTVDGTAATKATLDNGAAHPADFTPVEQGILMNNSISVVINGDAKKVKPLPTATINNMTDYANEIQNRLDEEYGIGIVSVTAPGGLLTFETLTTPDGIKPSISVDFPRVHESKLISDINELIDYLDTGDHSNISSMLTVIDDHMGNMLSLRADIGARTNRMDLMAKKIASNNVSFTKLLSDAEDADMSEVIMELKNAENVYKASLSTGARVIQPSLIDFLR